LDIKKILSSIEERYHIKLPRFKYVEKPIGEPTKDGLTIFFYEDNKDIVAVEILDLKKIV